MFLMTTQTKHTIETTPGATNSTARTAGLRRRGFARLWAVLDTPVDDQVAEAKADIFSEIEGPIVEIGAGHGSNFRRYPAGTAVIAFEPNRFMGPRMIAAAEAADIDLELHTSDLRDARLPSDSIPTVVSVLTLCSVSDRANLLGEIHRILQPNGRFLFVEHVAETTNRRRRSFQKLIRPAWRALFDSCDPSAPTDRLIGEVGFADLRTTTRNLGPAFDPTNRTHWGVATK